MLAQCPHIQRIVYILVVSANSSVSAKNKTSKTIMPKNERGCHLLSIERILYAEAKMNEERINRVKELFQEYGEIKYFADSDYRKRNPNWDKMDWREVADEIEKLARYIHQQLYLYVISDYLKDITNELNEIKDEIYKK